MPKYCQRDDCANLAPCCDHLCLACLYYHDGNSRHMSGVKGLCVPCDIYLCHVFTDLDPNIPKSQHHAYYYNYIREKIYLRQYQEAEEDN